MSVEHIYLVIYDISDPKRLRRVFKIMEGYGQWVQLSAFQCRLSPRRHQRLISELSIEIKANEDHVILFKLGPAGKQAIDFVSLGRVFDPVKKEPVII